jgi:hypothetical protein
MPIGVVAQPEKRRAVKRRNRFNAKAQRDKDAKGNLASTLGVLAALRLCINSFMSDKKFGSRE